MDEERLSQTKKAKAARNWRKVTSQRKKFEGTMKEFLKVKYLNIYNEYVHFHNVLDTRYPDTRELFKTPDFKKWATEIRQDRSTQSEITTIRHKDQSTQSEVQPIVSFQDQFNQRQDDQLSSDVLSVALHETLSQVIPPQDQGLDDDIEKIINELEQDNAVQAILDPFVDAVLDHRNQLDDIIQQDNDLKPNDDEGIELNLEDEIEVEPFDYNLEVDF